MIALELSDRKVSEERVVFVEKQIGIKFPHSFVDLVKEHDGGYPIPNLYKYHDIFLGRDSSNCLGAFLTLGESEYLDILKDYKNPAEFFPNGLIAFADDGGGNLLCFDYRQGKDNLNPPIVFWNHEANEGEDVSFVAKDFETFLGMLYLDEE